MTTRTPAQVEVLLGDITQQQVDAIVNAANDGLWAGGGVCGAIFAAAGGVELEASCRSIGGCPTGSAVVTPSHRLAERGIQHIIHAVGPVWDPRRADECDQLLASAYRTSLHLAEELGLRSIAFPSLSTGIHCFPRERAAAIAVRETTSHVGGLERIVLMAYDADSYGVLAPALAAVR